VGDGRKLAEHLLLLEERQDLRAELGREALKRVRNSFSIDCMVRQYEELYEGLGRVAGAAVRTAAGV
jgi:glycosyltransferase involved in cell wall biosynthesis